MWIRESTDEEFIPQHRIKYFKREGDGEIVWNRDERIDKIFGTGLGHGAAFSERTEDRSLEDGGVLAVSAEDY